MTAPDRRQGLRDVMADEFARHGSTMDYRWDDDRVRFGCTCGHDRGVATKAELATTLSSRVQDWRRHVADAVLALPEIAALLLVGDEDPES